MLMSRYIDIEWLKTEFDEANEICFFYLNADSRGTFEELKKIVEQAPITEIVRCKECRKSHVDGKTTHYLWCTEWGRSTDTFGHCERGEREGE